LITFMACSKVPCVPRASMELSALATHELHHLADR
jgi:hypothetical protein